MLFYLDTSALLKRYKTEEGTEVVEKLFEYLQNTKTRAFISRFTILEIVSGLQRLRNTKGISSANFNGLMALFFEHDLKEFLTPYPLSEPLLNEATEKIRAHGIRAGDAIQLVTASAVSSLAKQLNQELLFLADDTALNKAGAKEGLRVLNPREKNAARRLETALG